MEVLRPVAVGVARSPFCVDPAIVMVMLLLGGKRIHTVEAGIR